MENNFTFLSHYYVFRLISINNDKTQSHKLPDYKELTFSESAQVT